MIFLQCIAARTVLCESSPMLQGLFSCNIVSSVSFLLSPLPLLDCLMMRLTITSSDEVCYAAAAAQNIEASSLPWLNCLWKTQIGVGWLFNFWPKKAFLRSIIEIRSIEPIDKFYAQLFQKASKINEVSVIVCIHLYYSSLSSPIRGGIVNWAEGRKNRMYSSSFFQTSSLTIFPSQNRIFCKRDNSYRFLR